MTDEAGTSDVIDGWNYWTRVYSDSAFRDELTGDVDGPYLSQVLSSEALKSTRVLIDQLPKNLQECDVKSRLEQRIGAASVFDVHFRHGRCVVKFYRASDATAAVRLFDGEPLSGRRLSVRLQGGALSAIQPPTDHSLDDSLDEASTLSASGRQSASSAGVDSTPPPPPLAAVDPDDNADAVESPSDGLLASRLADLLEATGPLRHSDANLRLAVEAGAPSTAAVFAHWPLGVLRCLPQLRLVGPFVCRPQQEYWAFEECSLCGAAPLCREQWEPMAPCQIGDRRQLVGYVRAFLQHFGPLWLRATAFALLLRALPTHCSLGVGELKALLETSADFVLFRDTAYLRYTVIVLSTAHADASQSPFSIEMHCFGLSKRLMPYAAMITCLFVFYTSYMNFCVKESVVVVLLC